MQFNTNYNENLVVNSGFRMTVASAIQTGLQQRIMQIYQYFQRAIIEILALTDDDSVCNKDIILILSAKDDHNGAVTVSKLNLFLWNIKSKILGSKVHYVFKTVSSDDEFSRSIEKMKMQGNRIPVLWVIAHGRPQSMLWSDSPGGRLNRERLSIRQKRALNSLEKDATIILDSCQTGKVDAQGRTCIAQTLASAVPGRTVIAPIQNVSLTNVFIKENQGMISAEFWGARISSENKILNIWYKMSFWLFRAYSESIGARFKHYQPTPML